MADNIRPDGLMAGERVYKGKGLGDLVVWKCPACAVENTGPLSKGCTACGAGSAQPSHVGVPPPRTAPTQFFHEQRRLTEDDIAEARALTTPVDQAFERWYQKSKIFEHDVPRHALLEAWAAGIAWYRSYLAQQNDPGEPAPGEDPHVVAVPRELLKDVLKQLENTVDLPETDSQSPELLALISRIRELVE